MINDIWSSLAMLWFVLIWGAWVAFALWQNYRHNYSLLRMWNLLLIFGAAANYYFNADVRGWIYPPVTLLAQINFGLTAMLYYRIKEERQHRHTEKYNTVTGEVDVRM